LRPKGTLRIASHRPKTEEKERKRKEKGKKKGKMTAKDLNNLHNPWDKSVCFFPSLLQKPPGADRRADADENGNEAKDKTGDAARQPPCRQQRPKHQSTRCRSADMDDQLCGFPEVASLCDFARALQCR
jgi:hypothetical protein